MKQDGIKTINLRSASWKEELKLLWEQEQKIMFCDVSTMDVNQRAYVMAMGEQIAKKKVALLSSRSGVDGDGGSCS
jgi:hypothetical protein